MLWHEGGNRMLNGIYAAMMLGGIAYAFLSGSGGDVGAALLSGAQSALETVWNMAGALMFFGGVMEVLCRAGFMDGLVNMCRRPLRRLFGQDVSDEALGYICMNLSANMLGMGGAATPAGIRAMQLMADGQRAGAGMCLFLVLNTTSVQLFPTTLIAMRASMGAVRPESIVLPSLIATSVSTLGGLLFCKWMERRAGKR